MEPDFLDEMIAKRADVNADFPAMVEAARAAREGHGTWRDTNVDDVPDDAEDASGDALSAGPRG